MTSKKTTRRALFSSVISLILCFAMLIGTTFAWFTDTVTSGRNTIQSGNLDMKVSFKPYGAENTEWTEVNNDIAIFNDAALYEPGYTEAVWLKVENVGSLAFKYNMAIDVYSETPGVNQAGETFYLSDSLVVKSVAITDLEGWEAFYTTRDSFDNFAWGTSGSVEAELKDQLAIVSNGVAFPNEEANDTAYVLVVIQMPTTVGNEANHKTAGEGEAPDMYQPKIELGLNALATQVPHEEDSFGNDYDADATYPDPTVKTFEELKEAVAEGGNIVLDANIEVTEMVEIPENGSVSIDGQGYTLTRADSYTGTILSLGEYAELTLSNITLDGENVESTGNLIYIDSFGELTLNNGAVLENHVGGTTYDPERGPENSVIHCDGETTIVMNDGSVIRNNVAKGSFATAIASMYGLTCELNGGKIINNTSEKNNYTVSFGNSANVTVSDGFEAYGNTDGGLMRVNQQSSFTMNGGKLDGNGKSAIYTWVAKYVTLNGGEIVGNVSLNYTPATVGGTDVNGVIYKDNEVTKWALNLTPDFGTVRYSIAGNITQLNIVPAEGYTYAEGDEDKLICENAGYETYWDAEDGCFKVQASN